MVVFLKVRNVYAKPVHLHAVVWAHPEFGQVLASCGFDKKVMIWEETEGDHGTKKWNCVSQLVDARDAVVDVKFAPPHLGLQLVDW